MLRAVLNFFAIHDAADPPELDGQKPLIYAFHMNSEEYIFPAPEYHEGSHYLSIGDILAARSFTNDNIYLTHSPESTKAVRVLDCRQRYHSMNHEPSDYWNLSVELPPGSQMTVKPGAKMLAKNNINEVDLYVIYSTKRASYLPPIVSTPLGESLAPPDASIDVVIVGPSITHKTGDTLVTISSDEVTGSIPHFGEITIQKKDSGILLIINEMSSRFSIMGSIIKDTEAVIVKTSSYAPLKVTLSGACYLLIRSVDAPIDQLPVIVEKIKY